MGLGSRLGLGFRVRVRVRVRVRKDAREARGQSMKEEINREQTGGKREKGTCTKEKKSRASHLLFFKLCVDTLTNVRLVGFNHCLREKVKAIR